MSGSLVDLIHQGVHAAKPSEMLFRFLDTNGDGSGTKNAIGNYSTPDDFYIQPPNTETYFIHRMLIRIEDLGAVQSGNYGALAGLTNGITIKVMDDSGDILDLTDSTTIKTNGDWGGHCYDVLASAFASGNDYVLARWTFTRSGNPIILSGSKNEKLVVTLSDNLTGLVQHTFQVQGHKE